MKNKQPAPLSLRLPKQSEAKLKLIVEKQGIPLNQFVVDAIHRRIEQIESEQAAA